MSVCQAPGKEGGDAGPPPAFLSPLGAGGPGTDTKPATCCFSILLAHLVRDGVALVMKSCVP
ncbi:hypothetical protein CGMCC3_g6944 [Colletotrichum fructicola]|nr:uncharacterized protein CGMCC3_g6944 [Colletotrichum fructicola]KAE9577231.1 hypothetical protein CGMCC3_g6944 [Colletotrichum fructicola]